MPVIDQRTREMLRDELRKVAPGTRLREGLDMVLAAGTGALVVIGDETAVNAVCNGGFHIDTPFTPQRLFELGKMDGAIILDRDAAGRLHCIHVEHHGGLHYIAASDARGQTRRVWCHRSLARRAQLRLHGGLR